MGRIGGNCDGLSTRTSEEMVSKAQGICFSDL